jgi:hypothetical protein
MNRTQDAIDVVAELMMVAREAIAVASLAGATPEIIQDLLLAYNAAWAAYTLLTGATPA